MTHRLNENDVWESLAQAVIVTQWYREIIAKVAEGQQVVKTKSRGNVGLHEVIKIFCETSARTSRQKSLQGAKRRLGFQGGGKKHCSLGSCYKWDIMI